MCEFDPFPLPCGVAACCNADGQDHCENLTKNECAARGAQHGKPVFWRRGQYCGGDPDQCSFSACLTREGECLEPHASPGCKNPFCCVDICDLDPYCCRVEWDATCVESANELCGSPIPVMEPADGMLDTHPLTHAGPRHK